MEEGKEGEKEKWRLASEERKRKNSTSSVRSSVGSLESFWGKKREREEETEDLMEEKGGFKRSGKTRRSPEKGDKRGRGEGEGGKDKGNDVGDGEDMKRDREERKELKEEIRKQREEMKKEREERRRMEEEWRRRLEQEMREERGRTEGLVEKLGKLEGRERRMEEVMKKVEGWEKERKGVEGGMEVTGNAEEWRLRVRRIEVMQDKKERERKRSNVVVSGLGEGCDVKAEVGRVWERMGLGWGE